MKSTRFLIGLVILFPLIASAQQCRSYGFLKSGFDFNAYKQCQSKFASCPKSGPMLDAKCIKEIMKQNSSCTQLQKLADVVKGTPASLTVEAKDNFAIADQMFIADGQHSYYIISPKGCLVDTKIDPRNISPALKKEHKNIPVVIINWDKPQFATNAYGTRSFTALLKLMNTCLACEVLGWAKVRFDFKPDGRLANTVLQSFTKKKPA